MAEDFLPPTVRACLNAYIENGDINPEPTTYSIADNKRTVKVEMTWCINQQVRAELDRQCTEYYEQQNREYEREKREKEQQKRQHETETRKVGDYTKLKQIARSHGRNRWQPKSNNHSTSANFQPFPAIKEEPADHEPMPEAASTPASSAATLQLKEEEPESSKGGAESINNDTGSWQEVKKKKPRNRRFKRKNKATGTQTKAMRGTDETGEELSELLDRMCHFDAPDILSPLKEVD